MKNVQEVFGNPVVQKAGKAGLVIAGGLLVLKGAQLAVNYITVLGPPLVANIKSKFTKVEQA